MFPTWARCVVWICLLIVEAVGADPISGGQGTSRVNSAAFQKVVLATGLDEPIQLSVARDGRVFFGERHGGVKVWRPDRPGAQTLGRLEVFTGPEDGLLGMVLDPGFLTNHWLYLFHSVPGILENRVSRFTVTGDSLDLASGRVLLRIPTLIPKPNHSGGGLAFDGAGNLYVSTGDYTSINDSEGYSPLDDRPGREIHDSQRTAANSLDLRGKILRIHPLPDGTYEIPAGNLFPPGTPKTLPEIYIMGCRNPFRFSVDEKTGWLFWGDVGPDAVEPSAQRGPAGFDEFNVATRAGNFGWPYFLADNKPYRAFNFANRESGSPFDPRAPVNRSANNTGIVDLPPAQPALIWYPPGFSTRFPQVGSGARSAMAGPRYHFNDALESPRKFPREYDGALFIFEWERSWICTVRLDSEGRLNALEPFAPQLAVKRPISMSFGPDGALYLLEWGSAWANNRDAQLVRFDYVP